MLKFLRNRSSIFVILCSAVLLFAGSGAASELPFPVGEELVYSITWIGVPMAYAKVSAQEETFEGRDVLALRMEVRTYSFFNHIFKVEDLYETLVDPVTFLPIQHTENISEKNYRRHEVTTFDFEKLTAHYRHLLNGKEKSYDIKPDSRDILSFMYFMRSADLKEDSKSEYRVLSDEKLYDLFVTTYDVDAIDLPHYDEEIPGLKMRPEAKFDGLFVRKGKAKVWISRDPRHLLVLARLSTPFGRVSITLHDVTGPGDDFWITERKDVDDEEAKEQQGDRGDSGALGLDPTSGQATGDDRW